MHPRYRSALALSLLLMIACADREPLATESSADPSLANSTSPSCAVRVNNTTEKLLECVTVDGVRAHQAALQAIADANGGIRSVGTPGYAASIDYIAGQLQAAGYEVTVQPFTFFGFVPLAPAMLDVVAPAPATVPTRSFTYSGSGDVTAPVSGVANLGCDAADFAGFPAGNIALISRGACPFALKATNAYAAGAGAVVIYNNAPGTINGTLGADFALDIPVVATSQADGLQLAATPGLVMRVRTSFLRGEISTVNLLAETPDGDPDNVVMVGAHLDGVPEGPGINDNGSGSGAILEAALQMARVKPWNKVRFAWWGAEELGLIGSWHYVQTLSDQERQRIALYLNFDMIGSPNHGFFVYDGGGWYPQGSEAITDLFGSFYDARSLPHQGVDIFGASDHTAFLAYGIPSGGLLSGAGAIKTAEQAALWGGTAGVAFDPCYHKACDTYDNVNLFALDVNADAVAHAMLTFAMNTSLVNGQKGKGNFGTGASRAPAQAHSHGDEPVVQ